MGDLCPWALAGVPAQARGLGSVSIFYEPVGGQRDNESSGDRAGLSRSGSDGEAVYAAIPGGTGERLFHPAAASVGVGAEGRVEGESTNTAGGR